MRFAHIADTHLGYRQYNLDEREEDFYRAFHEAVDKIIAAKCDFVIHSGDLFDDPRPHVQAMVEAMNGLEKLKDAGIKVFAIAGNHDVLMRRGAMPPQRLYRSMELLTPMKPSRVFDDVYICGMPYYSQIHSEALKEKLQELAEAGKNYEKAVLMLHQGLDKYFHLEYELKFNDLPRSFDYYALGHVHKRIIGTYGDGKLAYPGSTEIWRIDELQDWEEKGKGFFIIDTKEFEVEKVNLDVRRFIKMEVDSRSNIQEIKNVLEGAKKPVVNITITSDAQEYQRIYRKLINELTDALYVNIKRNRVEEKEEILFGRAVSIKELIREALKEHSKTENEYAYSVFNALTKGDIDDARSLTEDFYKNWNSNSDEPKAKKEEKGNLEVFK